MTSMVERVARAMFEANAAHAGLKWADLGECSIRVNYRQMARAAIAAMREPTELMWSGLARQIILWDRSANPRGETLYRQLSMTGCPVPDWLGEYIPNTGHCPSKGNVACAIFRAMLDAALVEVDGSDG